MRLLYNLITQAVQKSLPLVGKFSDKMAFFATGRGDLFKTLASEIRAADKTVWIHAASLGEYEQAVPVIEELRHLYPTHKIVLSFFSPSGYEIKKNSSLAHVVTYLPIDTPGNAKRFMDIVHPDLVMFVKYEFWPNFLRELKQRKIRSFLISGVFREDQAFFKFYGKWMTPYLQAFEYFFLQNQKSAELLAQLGYENAVVSGDTRYDRVAAQLNHDNKLPFIEDFLGQDLCVVAGSTWPEDIELLIDFINSAPENTKFIIAPHALKQEHLEALRQKLKTPTIFYSEKENHHLASYKVFIIDTIGLLTRIYSYATIAYVGGAAGDTGLHNVLEPAAFGVPVVIGSNYKKFAEAADLKEAGALFSVNSGTATQKILSALLTDKEFRLKSGKKAAAFIEARKGATARIVQYLLKSR